MEVTRISHMGSDDFAASTFDKNSKNTRLSLEQAFNDAYLAPFEHCVATLHFKSDEEEFFVTGNIWELADEVDMIDEQSTIDAVDAIMYSLFPISWELLRGYDTDEDDQNE